MTYATKTMQPLTDTVSEYQIEEYSPRSERMEIAPCPGTAGLRVCFWLSKHQVEMIEAGKYKLRNGPVVIENLIHIHAFLDIGSPAHFADGSPKIEG